MNTTLIIAGAIAVTSFGSAWKIQDWRMGAKEKEYVEQALVDQRAEATNAIRRTETVIKAQSEGATRSAGLRRDAAGARTAIVSLSDAAEQALREAATSHNTCLDRATTLDQLLGTMATAGGELAEKAGRHVNDLQTLEAAWPK